ncbi:MAG: hypothetical protein SFX73_32355 [Kofleriaceae bacterium]|nr:hypothetical protein [Kofleriaceae bacterium]
MRALLIILLVSATAAAEERNACPRGARFRGVAIDLDVKGADIHDVFRVLAQVGKINIVVPDDVKANVTLTVKKVPWDQVACTIVAMHKLRLEIDGNVMLVMPSR